MDAFVIWDQIEIDLGLDAAHPARQIEALADDEVLVFSWAWQDGDTRHSGEDHMAPHPYKLLPLLDPEIDMTVTQTGADWQITLSAKRPAFFATLEADCDGRFSDNGILLRPGHPRIITFSADEAGNKPDFTLQHLHKATYGAVSLGTADE